MILLGLRTNTSLRAVQTFMALRLSTDCLVSNCVIDQKANPNDNHENYDYELIA